MKLQNKAITITSLIVVALSVFYVFNLIHFINGNNINSPWIDGGIKFNSNPFLGIASISIGFIGGLLGTVSIVYLIFEYKWYWILTIIGQSLTIVDSLITGVFLTAISYSCLIVLLVTVNNLTINIKEWILYMIWSAFVIFGLTSYAMINNEITSLNIIDCFCSGLSIYAWFHIMNQNKRDYILFIINDILYLIAFAIIGLVVVSVSFVVYGIINLYCLIELSKRPHLIQHPSQI